MRYFGMVFLSGLIMFALTSFGCAQPGKKEGVDVKENVVFQTSQGEIEFTLFDDASPKACENFRGLVKRGYYDGTIFHRVIRNFMIQGGDPAGTGRGGESIWGSPFQDEFSADLKFSRMGLLAMANAGPNTNGSQFFITTAPTPWLNGKHTIFGEVARGLDVMQKIGDTQTGPGDRPVQEQKIIKAYFRTVE
jgi:peptidylprolyl isomerase